MSRPRKALLSVSDKTGIRELGKQLAERGFQLLSTGGTAAALGDVGLEVTPVATVTGHPEMMGGRVKTLHPAIHGPLLARWDHPDEMEALQSQGYEPIDVVVVNLYPFRETVANGDVSVEEAMEQVDIGGPTMLRAAAKNHAFIWVVVDPEDYPRLLEALDEEAKGEPGRILPAFPGLRRELAGKVFQHVAAYDASIAEFLGGDTAGQQDPAALPPVLNTGYRRVRALRYGENPDQGAAFYRPSGFGERGIAALRQLQGKELSYNNFLDLDGALLSLAPFALSRSPAVCIVKHTTPCGLAVGDTVEAAFEAALRTDPTSAFGSVIATNRTVDGPAATALTELFVECLVAPGYTEEALETLSAKANLRVLTFPGPEFVTSAVPIPAEALLEYDQAPSVDDRARKAARFLAAHGRDPRSIGVRGIYGGLLAQNAPTPPFIGVPDARWKVVTDREPTDRELEDLGFAWAAVFGVKSNAILLAREGATLGIGAGQMSRVDASRLAVQKAHDQGHDLEGCVLASDAFFPFRDGVDAAAEAGVAAIVQPGGSVRDEEVITAADEHGLTMVFAGRRLFRH